MVSTPRGNQLAAFEINEIKQLIKKIIIYHIYTIGVFDKIGILYDCVPANGLQHYWATRFFDAFLWMKCVYFN